MSFRIFFRGLIAHVQVDASKITRAVLIDAHKHDPTLIVKKGDLNNTTGTVPTKTVAASGETLFDLTGWDVSIAGTQNIQTKRVGGFDDHVPSLPECLVDATAGNKIVKKDIHDKKHIGGKTFSYVDYTDGTIESADCYTTAVKFKPAQGGDPECVVKIVLYSVELRGDVTLNVTKAANSGTIVLNPNVGVSVSNRAGKGNHFAEYQKITDASDIRIPEENEARLCVDCIPRNDESVDHGHELGSKPTRSDQKVKARRAASTVECTQTRFP